MIVIVLGLPGSGKSYFASRLAKKINAEYINSDQLRREIFSVRTYAESEREAVYSAMLNRVKAVPDNRKNIVLDATFYKEKIRNKFRSEIEDTVPLKWIEVVADEPVIKSRLLKPRPLSEADYAVYRKIKAQWEPLGQDHLVLESRADNLQEMLEKAGQYLESKND